ncbi:MAG: HsdR family type I site-specific deoxyribonuclease [Deltaproteobacteria bacterium]|nr:HsdR family type I site-specific deoxyribonuclease [Deltaproteobacteria bacterium]
MTKLGTERSAVQNTLIQYACEIGWEYVKPEEALRLRGGKTGLVFRETFTDQMARLNSEFIDSSMIEDLIRRIEILPPRVEGNLQAWEYLKGLKTVFVPDEKRERNVTFVAGEPKENVFHVTDEFEYTNGRYTNRYDVVFLINGVPVVFVETKAVAKFIGKRGGRDSIVAEALDQIRRYHRETPEAMSLFQLTTATNIIHFLYSATWNLSPKSVFNWKEESGKDVYEDLVKTFFDRQRIVGILLDFILFTSKDDAWEKVVLRPHQMRAVEKVIQRAAEKKKKRGLVWHTQGSGKTYTMIVAAQLILENPLFENPTVLMLVDRNELETQLFGNLASAGFEHVEVTKSKKHLRELLQNDTRGLIVSMIHKFEGMPKDMNTRKNFFVLVDEAHRTTGGDLGNYLMGALPNATYLGFTGTPIDRTASGKGTFVVFGKDDPPKGYLDKYGIAESIEDGTTVGLHYTLAPNELRPKKEILEKEFLNLAEAEGITDIETLNKVLERAVTLKNMLKNRQRVKKVTRFVVDHFREFVEPMGYKAFLVGVDREACALYKKELDKHLPEEYSEVVISAGHNDPEELARYHLSGEREKRIRKAFRNPEKLPKILIVTEKLLTGFDAPILYSMYLDKPMRDHVLLQAIARVNRPYEPEEGRPKPAGFVLDFVGIFDKLEKALAFDSGDITGVVKDIEVLKGKFGEMMEHGRTEYLSLLKGKTRDKAVEAVLEHFRDEDVRQEFYEFFNELSDIYEILSPDAFLRPYIEDFDTLARMFRICREAFEPGVFVDREFARKTAKLVQEHTESGQIRGTLDIYELDENTLRKIEEDKASDTEKVFNLLKSIGITVDKGIADNPYLQSIGEKAEIISRLFMQRQKDTQQTLEELKRLIEEINQARKERASKKMPKEVFTAYWILRDEKVEEPEDKANSTREVFEKYPYWRTSEEHERKLKQGILKIFTKSRIAAKRAVELTNKIITVLKGASE